MNLITCQVCGHTRFLREVPRLVLGGIDKDFITWISTYPEDPGCPNCALRDTKESF